jgi:hypothetical protein
LTSRTGELAHHAAQLLGRQPLVELREVHQVGERDRHLLRPRKLPRAERGLVDDGVAQLLQQVEPVDVLELLDHQRHQCTRGLGRAQPEVALGVAGPDQRPADHLARCVGHARHGLADHHGGLVDGLLGNARVEQPLERLQRFEVGLSQDALVRGGAREPQGLALTAQELEREAGLLGEVARRVIGPAAESVLHR